VTAEFNRMDTRLVSRWWWTVDRLALASLGALIFIGAVLAMAATPPVAERIGLDSFYFVRRQIALLPVAIAILLGVSLLEPKQITRLALLGFVGSLVMLGLTFMIGVEIKGARRWINLGGFSLQPSEFVKPTFAVVTAWLFATARREDKFPGDLIAMGLFGVVLGILALQPDIGMAFVVTVVWFFQFFLAGLSMLWVVALGLAGGAGILGAYFVFPHVASRVNRFLDPSSGDTYQVSTSLEAFLKGGLLGRGPGEGTVKSVLPDAHSDFIFAVAGEEMGMIGCLLIVALFAFIVLRGMTRMLQEPNLFVVLAVSGLLVQFALQALVNMGSTLHIIPTKGMTLPFISYGGSSLLALALSMGMMLALSRRRFGAGGLP